MSLGRPKEDGAMRIQVGPIRDASAEGVVRREVFAALASAIELIGIMGLALLILSLLLTS